MEERKKKLELIANSAIIMAAVLLGFVLVKDHVLPSGNFKQDVSSLTPGIGTKMSLDTLDWAKHPRTLLFVLSPGCHFCQESAPLYRQIVQRTAGRSDIRLVAVLPVEPSEGRRYVQELGVSIGEVIQADLKAINVGGTPTLILADSNGHIQGVWFGQLASEKETELLQRIGCETCNLDESRPPSTPVPRPIGFYAN